MRTIIAGSRTIEDYFAVEKAIRDCGWTITEVICGCAAGVDSLGAMWALKNNIPIREYRAKWELYGKSAGYKRNVLMAENADALVLVYDGKSKGSIHMLNIARDKKLKIYRVIYNSPVI
jgi:hypothetical protein